MYYTSCLYYEDARGKLFRITKDGDDVVSAKTEVQQKYHC